MHPGQPKCTGLHGLSLSRFVLEQSAAAAGNGYFCISPSRAAAKIVLSPPVMLLVEEEG